MSLKKIHISWALTKIWESLAPIANNTHYLAIFTCQTSLSSNIVVLSVFSHHPSCCLGPQRLIFAVEVTTLSTFFCDLIFGCLCGAVCAFWGETGPGAAAPASVFCHGAPGPRLPHQSLRSPNRTDRPIAPRLRSDGNRAEGNRLDLHFWTCTFSVLAKCYKFF